MMVFVLRDPQTQKFYVDLEKHPLCNEWSDDIEKAKQFETMGYDHYKVVRTVSVKFVEIVTIYVN